jgi:CHASE2 domain-containing sensor protein
MATTVECAEAGKLAGYVQNELTVEEAAAVDKHLAACRSCLDAFVELGRKSAAPQVPGCHVVKEIGRGRFGVVYKAWSVNETPRVVALKVLSSHGEMEEHRFEREISVLKKIDSPWIVKCHDSGTIGDARYYVMDLVEGVHLDEYLAKSNLDLEGKLTIFQRVCRAVADAHTKGVIHRDLKPRNILIDAEGQPHILDFGICSVESTDGSSQGQTTITHAGDVIGTLKYMSPEQAWGGVTRSIDERSDIWSLGVMLYEIVTDGGYPYSLKPMPDRTPHESLLERIRRELPRLPRLDKVPRGRELEILLERCLAWEPEQRIESARGLAVDLARYCRGRRIKTKPLRMAYRMKRLAIGAAVGKRWIFPIMFIAIMAILLVAATFVFDVGWRVAGHEYDRAETAMSMAGTTRRSNEGVRIVGVFDDTVDAVVAFAADRGIEGVTASVPTWRGVHAHLMKRLVRHRPAALVWDYYFRTPQPADGEFVSGVQALEAVGVPVILASLTYGEEGQPELSPAIVEALGPRLRHGAIGARDMVLRPGEFILAAQKKDGSIIPSLAITAAAAVLHPETTLDMEWEGRRKWLQLLYELTPGAFLRERDRIDLSQVYRNPRASGQPGHLLGVDGFALKRPEFWEERTVPYERLLRCTDDELAALVSGKLVIVGDFRMPRFGFRADRHPVKYGASIEEEVPGCYLLTDAIVGLLNRRYVRSAFPPTPTTFSVMLLLALVGSLAPIGLVKWVKPEWLGARRSVWLLALTPAAVCLVVMVLAVDWGPVHVGMGGFMLLTPMVGALWVESARNRHRIVVRKSRAMEELGALMQGTLTLPPRRRKSRRGAR